MGVTESNNKSTSPHLKPGTSYFYPMLKIHKLNKVDLKPGVKPPARLVTALQDGISTRSDIFTADRFSLSKKMMTEKQSMPINQWNIWREKNMGGYLSGHLRGLRPWIS